MVDREVDGPVWVVLGRFGGLCVRSWAALGTFVGGPGPLLWPLLAVSGRSWASAGGLGPSWGLCWRSWAAPGALWAVLGRSWGLSWRSWAALGAYVGGLGPLMGPLWAVLGRSWVLCWQSWAALGRKVAQTRTGARCSEARLAGLAGICPKDRIALKPSPHFFKRYAHIQMYTYM